MSSAQRYSCLPGLRHESIYYVATRLVTALLQVLPAKIMQGSRDLPWSNTAPSGRDEQSASLWRLLCLPAGTASESRHLASFRRGLSRGAQVFLRCCRGFSHFGCGLNRKWQLQLRLFRSPMVAMVQRPDARSFFFRPQLSVSSFLALVLKV
jgi:hypothetical protein